MHGQLIDLGSHKLHLYPTGKGNLTVVLDAGLSDTSLGCSRVQEFLTPHTPMCSYERVLRMGQQKPQPRTSDRLTRELYEPLSSSPASP